MRDQERPNRKHAQERRRSSGDRSLGDRIRKFRVRRGLNQRVTAHRIERSEQWLLQVENGRADPGYSDLLKLAPVLGVHISQLVAPPSARASAGQPDGEHELTAVAGLASEPDAPVDRREFNQIIVGSLFGIPALLDWEHFDATLRRDRTPDPQLLDQLRVLVSALSATASRQLDTGSPELLAPMLQGALAFTQALPQGQDRPPALAETTSRLALLYGWISFQLDNKFEARRTYRLAAGVAREANLSDLHATVLAAASQLDSSIPYGGYQSSNLSLTTLDQAESLTNGISGTSVLRAWILARRAQERAAAGDASGAAGDLAAARAQFRASDVTTETFYAYPNDGWITGYEASCHRLTGHWPEAEESYSCVLSLPSSPLWRAVTMSSLASVQARQGDPDRAADTLRQAVSLAIDSNTPLRIRHVYGARVQLDRFSDAPAVRHLDDFLAQVVQV